MSVSTINSNERAGKNPITLHTHTRNMYVQQHMWIGKNQYSGHMYM